jgi:hypothetical protein
MHAASCAADAWGFLTVEDKSTKNLGGCTSKTRDCFHAAIHMQCAGDHPTCKALTACAWIIDGSIFQGVYSPQNKKKKQNKLSSDSSQTLRFLGSCQEAAETQLQAPSITHQGDDSY